MDIDLEGIFEVAQKNMNKEQIDYTQKYIIHCPTKNSWIKICEKINIESDLLWFNSKKPNEFLNWDYHKRNTCISLNVGCGIDYSTKDFFSKEYPDIKISLAKEFI